MILETNRLIIREYTPGDFDALYEILSDAETMKYYPKPYDENGVHRWINWCLDSYRQYGFGLWALELKETGTFIGDCGSLCKTSTVKCFPKSVITFTKNIGVKAMPRRHVPPLRIGFSETQSMIACIRI